MSPLQIRKEISSGDVLPNMYGVAWRDFRRDIAVCYPLPFNWVARWLHSVIFRLKMASNDSFPERIEREAFSVAQAQFEERLRMEKQRLEQYVEAEIKRAVSARWNQLIDELESKTGL